ncbi:hypothetical protein AK812_SmicGene34058 [Symbiodinium microadriaticum]|uniref:Uncharacterized protein n=1 Tax=Symbiodinium microadriaticum TaxID=2951 RepID=A0A1Q9CQ13_SYMMI|nr:hypothetical protein AK812_SmicGene34058 [Symbiodinium microadriaticum]CAE7905004.1 unnamed protein product [Symbiodinium microadriaticum]
MKQVFRPTCKLEPPLAEHSANRLKDLHSSPHKPSPEAEETEEVAVQDYSCSIEPDREYLAQTWILNGHSQGRFTYPGPLPGLACKAMPTRAFCLGLASSVLATCAGTSCSLRDARCRVEDGSEDVAALQLREDGGGLGSRRTHRDLAVVDDRGEMLLQFSSRSRSIPARYLGAVPSFGEKGNFIALLFIYSPALWAAPAIFCSGAGKAHRVQAKIFGGELGEEHGNTIVFQCDWPEADANRTSFDVFLEDGDGHELGRVTAAQNPSLLRHYGTVGCVRPLWNGDISAVAIAPQWLEFHALHGVEHFLVYTASDSDDVVLKMYEPFIKAGLVTRVHFNTVNTDLLKGSNTSHPAMQRHHVQTWAMHDCLYRMRSRAQWLLPSLDVDEYIRLGDSTGAYLRTAWDKIAADHVGSKSGMVRSIRLDRLNFPIEEKRDVSKLLIAAEHRYGETYVQPKYVMRPAFNQVLSVHCQKSWTKGTQEIQISPSEGFVAHYRVHAQREENGPHGQKPNVSDTTLLGQVPLLLAALDKRYGGRWPALAAEFQTGSSMLIGDL